MRLGKDLKPRIVLSGVNFVEGGPLAIFVDALHVLAKGFLDRFDVIAIVHRAELFDVPGISFVEFPKVKSSWLRRLYFEYLQTRSLSRDLAPYLWLSMHDVTPSTSASVRAVYCHNPAPFYEMPMGELFRDKTFTLFSFFYRFLYRINIGKNDFVIVQQEWLRKEFRKRYPIRTVIVAHPSIPPFATNDLPAKLAAHKGRLLFFYPALARSFKNFELLFEAVCLLEHRRTSGFEVQVTIDGTENSYARSLRKRFGHLTNITWLGKQTRKRVEEIYMEADCLIFPSKLETWGMPISEWKRTGKPMLVADLPFAHETVGDYSEVSFLDTRDAPALALSMERIMQGTAKFAGSQSVSIDAPFAVDWPQLFTILLAGAERGTGELSSNGSAAAEVLS